MSTVRKVIIIGSGPAAYTAAIYAARANLAPLQLTGIQAGGTPGGQLMLTTLVENYPGFVDGIEGPPLMDIFRKQAERFGTEMIAEDVTTVDFARRPFLVESDENRYEGQTVIIATGAAATLLGLDSEKALMGRGVSTCATCDGFFFRDQNVMVVGGGDSAMEEALYLSRLAQNVAVVHRRQTLRASKIMQERAFKNPKIEFVWNSVVEDIADLAQGKVTAAVLRNLQTGETSVRPVDGIFIAIGHRPNTQFVRGQVELWPNDYIKVVPGTTQTSVPGVFAAGDVQDFTYRQAVTAAGTGCMAALEAERFLEATAEAPSSATSTP
jgi:thioredoxin reductase (NADPH)